DEVLVRVRHAVADVQRPGHRRRRRVDREDLITSLRTIEAERALLLPECAPLFLEAFKRRLLRDGHSLFTLVANAIWPESGCSGFNGAMGTQLDDITGEWVFGPENKRNPHPLYHRIRSEAPIWKFEDFDDYLLTRWEDCAAVLRDPRLSSDPVHTTQDDDTRAQINATGLRMLLFMDPPDHTRLRRLVS